MKTSKQYRKTALITGASKGLGKSLAITCAKYGYDLILVALPQSSMQLLANEIKENHGVRVSIFEYDLTETNNIHKLASFVNENIALDLLINNAGCGGSGEFETSPIDVIDLVLQLNVRATSLLTRLLIPALKKADGKSHVMNISSMAAFSPIGYKHVYPASKAFLYAFTMSLREEFRDGGISFTSVHPGPMLTNYDTCRRIILQGAVARLCLVNTTKIAETALMGTLKGKSIIVPGLVNKFSYWAIKFLPSSLVKKLLTSGIKKEIRLSPHVSPYSLQTTSSI